MFRICVHCTERTDEELNLYNLHIYWSGTGKLFTEYPHSLGGSVVYVIDQYRKGNTERSINIVDASKAISANRKYDAVHWHDFLLASERRSRNHQLHVQTPHCLKARTPSISQGPALNKFSQSVFLLRYVNHNTLPSSQRTYFDLNTTSRENIKRDTSP